MLYPFGDSRRIITMPTLKYFGSVGLTLLVIIFVSDAYFGYDEGNSRFNGSLYESALYAPRLEEAMAIHALSWTPSDLLLAWLLWKERMGIDHT
jgi:hypothetical protein